LPTLRKELKSKAAFTLAPVLFALQHAARPNGEWDVTIVHVIKLAYAMRND